MLEGMQQTYPGAAGPFPTASIPQTGFHTPYGGVMGSGVQGLFGRSLDPLTQAYLQQAQLAQQQSQPGPQQFGLDPFTAAYLHHAVRHHVAQLLAQQYSQGIPGGIFGNPYQNPAQNFGQIGRPFGLDPLTIALLQQQSPWAQPFGQPGFGGQQFGRNPLQGQVGAGTYGPLGAWS
jgi:hypothetical protein